MVCHRHSPRKKHCRPVLVRWSIPQQCPGGCGRGGLYGAQKPFHHRTPSRRISSQFRIPLVDSSWCFGKRHDRIARRGHSDGVQGNGDRQSPRHRDGRTQRGRVACIVEGFFFPWEMSSKLGDHFFFFPPFLLMAQHSNVAVVVIVVWRAPRG